MTLPYHLILPTRLPLQQGVSKANVLPTLERGRGERIERKGYPCPGEG